MTGQAIARRHGSFSESVIDDEIVLMQIDSGEFFSLQGTGATIWRLIDNTADRDTVLAALAERFDAPRGMLADDLDAFLRSLADAGFIAAA